ncbi:septum formation inhibitor Maf [Vibrio sp. T187]|uniref:Maf family protein n=1 Tax=Vibrio TaxID=662 RepID=UPI0010C94D30|nr:MULTISPECIES: Maf family protein [Vibrio]MBW3697229.1 septum formation inhibitor Maf [Vibrio sp. T187]
MTDKKLVLASGSPRRKELLEQLGYSFSVIVTDVEEVKQEQEPAQEYVQRLALDKANAGLALAEKGSIVIGSDTVVVIDDQVMEKPRDYQDCRRMLNQLSDAQHQVMTAVSVVSEQNQRTVVVTTDVWFKPLSEKEIEQYWLSGEPCDKAGSYGIQGLGGRFVTRIEGSFHSVVGLPLFETDQLLHEFL